MASTPVPKVVWLSRRWQVTILIAAALSLIGKVTIASRTIGSTDALLWEASLRQLRESGAAALYENGSILRRGGIPYHAEVFNHPPFTLRLLSVGGWVADKTRLPLRFWLRVACALADLASTMLACLILRAARLSFSPLALLLTAASPVSLLISGFHGNTDPLMMAMLLLAVYQVQSGAAWRAGAALGLAASIKIVPLLFLPALALTLPGRKRTLLLAGAAGVFLAGSLPLAAERPGLIWRHVFGYAPQTGIWGISRLVAAFGTEAQTEAYAHFAKLALLLLLGWVSVWLGLRKPQPPIALQCALLAFLLLSLTPGFGVQYLTWLVPWACLLSGRQAAAFHGIGGLFLACYYTRAAHGFPWNMADSAATPVWYGSLIAAGLLCWLAIVLLTFSILRRTLRPREW
jgi:hypothetical protein